MSRGVLKDRKGNKEHELGQGLCVIGRDESCDIVFASDQELSRKHCLLFPLDGRYFLLDYKSSNGIRVNNQKVEQCFLKSGDEVALGEQAMIFTQIKDPEPETGGAGGRRFPTMLELKENLAKETVVLLEEAK